MSVLKYFNQSTQQWEALYGGNIMLSAPTDKDYTMTMFYIKKPKTLVDNTDVPELPEEFEELLVLGAYKRILDRNEDFDLGASVEALWGRCI